MKASRWSISDCSPTWIWPFCRKVGTGTTTANSFGSPLKSFDIVITVRSPSRAMTTFDALLKILVSAFETKKPQKASAGAGAAATSAANPNRSERRRFMTRGSFPMRWQGTELRRSSGRTAASVHENRRPGRTRSRTGTSGAHRASDQMTPLVRNRRNWMYQAT